MVLTGEVLEAQWKELAKLQDSRSEEGGLKKHLSTRTRLWVGSFGHFMRVNSQWSWTGLREDNFLLITSYSLYTVWSSIWKAQNDSYVIIT